MSRERNVTLDVLKTVAMFFVVMVHSHNVFDYAQTQPSNALIDYLSILANTGVPIFFLIFASFHLDSYLDSKVCVSSES